MKNLTFLLSAILITMGCAKNENSAIPTSPSGPKYIGTYICDFHYTGIGSYCDSLGNVIREPYDYHINPGEVIVGIDTVFWTGEKLMMFIIKNDGEPVRFYEPGFTPDSTGVFHDTTSGGSGYKYTYVRFTEDSIIADKYTRGGMRGNEPRIQIIGKKQ